MKKLILAISLLFLFAGGLSFLPATESLAQIGLKWFLPLMGLLFVGARFLSIKLGSLLEQPPLMIFLMALVMKLLGGLTILMVYLAKGLGPAMEGSFLFLGIYLILEILEINWFLSILRPDSRENTPE